MYLNLEIPQDLSDRLLAVQEQTSELGPITLEELVLWALEGYLDAYDSRFTDDAT